MQWFGKHLIMPKLEVFRITSITNDGKNSHTLNINIAFNKIVLSLIKSTVLHQTKSVDGKEFQCMTMLLWT